MHHIPNPIQAAFSPQFRLLTLTIDGEAWASLAVSSMHVHFLPPTQAACCQTWKVTSSCAIVKGVCAIVQPPLDKVPKGDWYCSTCYAVGMRGKRKKAAPKQAVSTQPRRVLRHRAQAAQAQVTSSPE